MSLKYPKLRFWLTVDILSNSISTIITSILNVWKTFINLELIHYVFLWVFLIWLSSSDLLLKIFPQYGQRWSFPIFSFSQVLNKNKAMLGCLFPFWIVSMCFFTFFGHVQCTLAIWVFKSWPFSHESHFEIVSNSSYNFRSMITCTSTKSQKMQGSSLDKGDLIWNTK